MQPGPGVDPYTARASPVRRRLLALLRERESGPDAHELAAVLGLHVTTVRSHLQILARAGLVTSRPDPRGRSGRPRTVYNATPEPGAPTDDRAQPTAYQELADVLAAHLDTAEGGTAPPEQAGMLWAARSAPTASPATDETEAAERVDRVCHELGFDPQLVADGDGCGSTCARVPSAPSRGPTLTWCARRIRD